MGKGIFGFFKWLWRGKLFPEEASDKLPPMTPETFANIILALNHSIVCVSFEQANVVAEKLAQTFGDTPWIGGIGIIPDATYGHVVRVGIDPVMLQIKPEQFEDFCFTQTVDGVHVRFAPEEMAVAYKKHDK